MPSRERLRVAMVADWFFYYMAGLANALCDDADILMITRKRGDELGSPDVDATAAKRAALDPRVELITIGGRQSDPRTRVEARDALDVLHQFDPDVVHEQNHYDWRLRRVARGAGVPRLLTIHDVVLHEGDEDRHNLVHRAVATSLRREASAIVVHGEQQAALVRDQPWYRDVPVWVVPVGVVAQPRGRRPLPARPCGLFFGRTEYYKGLDVLVEAVKLLPEDIDLRVVVAGQGHDAQRVRGLAGELPRIEWRLGFVPDDMIARLFAESTFVVLPYRDASQSGVVPLAFANGRPVVVTRVGSLPEVVEEGTTGLLVPPEDPQALADALARMASESKTVERMAEAAYTVATSGALSPAAVAARHLEIYRSMAVASP